MELYNVGTCTTYKGCKCKEVTLRMFQNGNFSQLFLELFSFLKFTTPEVISYDKNKKSLLLVCWSLQ